MTLLRFGVRFGVQTQSTPCVEQPEHVGFLASHLIFFRQQKSQAWMDGSI